MAISKKERKLVFDKCGGKCAYCGCDLAIGWHVDHIEPVGRKRKYVGPHYINKKTKEKQDQLTIIKLCQKEPEQAKGKKTLYQLHDPAVPMFAILSIENAIVYIKAAISTTLFTFICLILLEEVPRC